MLYRINQNENWRNITPSSVPDLHMKDIEIILRAIAILMYREEYKPSMTKFLNKFSNDAKHFSQEKINYLEKLFLKFVEKYSKINKEIFYTGKNRFSVTIFESIFYYSCFDASKNNSFDIRIAQENKLKKLREDESFLRATLDNTASKKSINIRLDKAMEIL